MQACWDSLNAEFGLSDYTAYPRATHKYVVFKTDTWLKYNILRKDTATIFSDYPLHYKVSEGSWYHGPETPIDSPTYQYAVVPLGYDYPVGIGYSEFEEMYMPDKDPEANPTWAHSEEAGILEELAYIRSGNEDELVDIDTLGNPIQRRRSRRQSWHPSGKVKYYDENLGRDVPVPLATIRVRTTFNAYSLKTDVNGDFYSQHDTRKKVKFELQWEGPYWDIRRGTYGQAKHATNRRSEPYDFFYDSGIRKAYCMAHLANYDYHYIYAPFLGIEAPPTEGTTKLKISVNTNNDGVTRGRLRLPDALTTADITLSYDINSFSTELFYYTVSHELTHAAHWDYQGLHNVYLSACHQLKESWALAVGWKITKLKYGSYGSSCTQNDDNFQKLRYSNVVMECGSENKYKWYTPFFIDLHDSKGDNQRSNSGAAYVNDLVYDYTFQQMYNSVLFSINLVDTEVKLMEYYQNTTENEIHQMVDYWVRPSCVYHPNNDYEEL